MNTEFVQQADGDHAEEQADDLRDAHLHHGLDPPRFFRQHDFSLSRRHGRDDVKLNAPKPGSTNWQTGNNVEIVKPISRLVRPPIIEGKYRYRLDEQPLGDGVLSLAVIQINPSIADGKQLDPVVGKIKKWAEGKYGLIVFLNLFAYINSRQTEIAENDYQILVGSQNDKVIKEEANQADKVIIAWGKPRGVFVKHYQRRIKRVLELLDEIQLHRVGKLSYGKYPRHGRMWNGENRIEYEMDISELL